MPAILVAHSYFLRFDEKQRQRARPYPPLATIQVASLLREAGHEVSLFDAMLAEGTEDFDSMLDSVQPSVVVIYEDNYNFLSKMCLGRMRQAATAMIDAATKAGARVIAAGSDASDEPAAYLAAGADAVLLGEGLATLMALTARLSREPALEISRLVAGLPDVASKTEGRLFRPQPVAPLPVPELARRPAWDLVDIEAYRQIWCAAHGYFSLNMAASRGCSFRCNWCAKPIWGDRYLQRDADAVAAEMRYLKDEFEPDHIWFTDDIFGFRAAWVEEFADRQTAGSRIPFTIQLRADLVTARMPAALARAGCREVWIGAESGSQRILDAMNKGTTTDGILRARRRLGEHGIRVGFFIMLGYLGETLEDLLATRDLIGEARPDDIGVSVAYPLPGTNFHKTVRRQLGRQTNWNESKDLSMMFSGTYRSEFYRAIRDVLHEQARDGMTVETRRRWDELCRDEWRYRHADSSTSPATLSTKLAH